MHREVRDHDVDRAVVDAAVERFKAADDTISRGEAERALREALEPGRLRLLTQFNALPEGVKFLVDLRVEVMRLAVEEPVLAALEGDLKSLLKSWFDVGFLELRRITWDSPASLLEKLIAYEAVHTIRSWQDLKDRLDFDRRCFGYFHPRMPSEPLIFVEVALVDGMASSIQALLDPDAPVLDPAEADTAIFYSISNAQRGLAGISFGNFLIKRVVDSLKGEFDSLKNFATLSPLPRFREWLSRELKEHGDDILLSAERERLAALGLSSGGETLLARALGLPDWYAVSEIERTLKQPMLRLAAQYLMHARRGKGAFDPVAHFHLTNGARIERLNWLGDTSEKGLAESAGMMVNYRYRLSDIETNHEAYTGEQKITASSAVRSLAKSS